MTEIIATDGATRPSKAIIAKLDSRTAQAARSTRTMR